MSTVLIADDEPELAQDLARRLKRCWSGVKIVAIASDGLQAAAQLRRHHPRVAFLDIRMPGLSGLEVAAAAETTRIVFVTAYEEYAVAAFEAAAVDYLVKPVSSARLAQCVLRLQQSSVPHADLAALLGKIEEHKPAHLAWVRSSTGHTTRMIAVTEVPWSRQTGAMSSAPRSRSCSCAWTRRSSCGSTAAPSSTCASSTSCSAMCWGGRSSS
jgi:DNA-binding LytR/AlgR family response regulator